MKLLIGADLVPTQSNMELFCAEDAAALVGDDLLAVLQSADYRIFNLEVPLADAETPIDKCGPALIAPTATVVGYTAIGVDCLTIANNHIMDQGVQGFFATRKTLEKSNIAFVGGGDDLSEAAKPYIIEVGGKKIGVYACTEHEFSIAGEVSPGANPFDPLESPDHVEALKEKCDNVIVLYHGGKEHYRYPSPNLQKVCRKLVEKGADLVICQHSHCVGCEEKYNGGTIVYGQGNFLFDDSTSDYWQTSLLIQINDDFSVSYIPLKKVENTVRLAKGDYAEKILLDFAERSQEIKDPILVEKRYEAFAQSMLLGYLTTFAGKESFLFRAINKLMGNRLRRMRIKKRYNRKSVLAIRNFVECEAHRELLSRGLQNKD